MPLLMILVGLAMLDGLLLYKRERYRDETRRLRAGMSAFERDRADAIVKAESERSGLLLQLAVRQSAGDEALHLAVSSESSFVALDRGGVRLRTMSARFGAERTVGIPPDTLRVTVPRGMRTVERRVTLTDPFELPAWLWVERKLAIPSDRSTPGWVGPDALVTAGGTLLYATPGDGPLADSSYVMPGAVRLAAADLKAIRDNVVIGMRVYFY